MTLNAKIGGFTDFFHDIGLRKSISFTRRRHRRQRHTRLWPMCIMVPMGRVQVICDFRNYNYWTGNAIGFRVSRELCSNFLYILDLADRVPVSVMAKIACHIFSKAVFFGKKTFGFVAKPKFLLNWILLWCWNHLLIWQLLIFLCLDAVGRQKR